MRKCLLFVVPLLCISILFLSSVEKNLGADTSEITVGPSGADITGSDNYAIQLAIDALASRGGGTVRVLPGEYILYDAVHLRSNVNLKGDRERTILKHCPPVSSRLLKDADRGQKEITPLDVSLFKPGMGVTCRSKSGRWSVHRPLTITRIENGVLYLNDYITRDIIADLDSYGKGGHEGFVTNIFSLIHGYEVENVVVEGFTVDSKIENFPEWENSRCAGVYLGRCESCIIRNITSINASGDGIFIDETVHTVTEDCESAYNKFHGFHPGSHSAHTTVRRCHLHHNGSDGLYICWGIHDSNFTDNIIHHNGIRKRGKRNGISIGHKDTDNLIANNHIYENAVSGINFREKTEANGAHRNRIINNIIENNGLPEHVEKGYGIVINGITHDLVFKNNIIRETREGKGRLQYNAFYIHPNVTRIQIIDNKINGHSGEAIIDNSKCPESTIQIK